MFIVPEHDYQECVCFSCWDLNHFPDIPPKIIWSIEACLNLRTLKAPGAMDLPIYGKDFLFYIINDLVGASMLIFTVLNMSRSREEDFFKKCINFTVFTPKLRLSLVGGHENLQFLVNFYRCLIPIFILFFSFITYFCFTNFGIDWPSSFWEDVNEAWRT